MIKENLFYFYMFISIIWFYVGSLIVWRFAIPELYRLLIKKENITREEILEKEQAKEAKRKRKV